MNQALAPVSSLSPGRRGDKRTKSSFVLRLGRFHGEASPSARKPCYMCAESHTSRIPARRPVPPLRRRDQTEKGTMAASVKIDFQPFGAPAGGDLVVFVGDDLKPADAALEIEPRIKDAIAGAAGPERFKGKPATALTIPAPAGLSAERLIAVGIGGENDRGKLVYADLGAAVAGKLAGRSGAVVAALPGLAPSAEDIAQMALGARLRLYKFDRYKTKKKEDDENGGTTRITFAVADPAAARKAAKAADGLAEGVGIARDLVNEPPNVLGPEEFANRAATLAKLGVEVEVLDEKALRKLGMRALLAVGQGSERESRVVVMRWNGGKASDKPVAFVGKG